MMVILAILFFLADAIFLVLAIEHNSRFWLAFTVSLFLLLGSIVMEVYAPERLEKATIEMSDTLKHNEVIKFSLVKKITIQQWYKDTPFSLIRWKVIFVEDTPGFSKIGNFEK